VAEKIRQKPLEFLCLMAGSFRSKTILTRASLHKKLYKSGGAEVLADASKLTLCSRSDSAAGKICIHGHHIGIE
jgi:hypothetical protein